MRKQPYLVQYPAELYRSRTGSFPDGEASYFDPPQCFRSNVVDKPPEQTTHPNTGPSYTTRQTSAP